MSILDYFKSKEVIFEEKFLPHIDALYRTALRLTGNKDDAEDLAQDTFLKAYEAFSAGSKVSSPKAYESLRRYRPYGSCDARQ
ncbi:MAG: sigma factor [Thermodesulfovibrionales bacterium]|nr:sigma factor [Thermodesulfovibrionales bacterium]